MKERDTQKAILDYLAATGVLAFRMNTGAVKLDERFMRFGVPGMADILAFCDRCHRIVPLWIECKSATGRQSELQRSFQSQVERHGHGYILARSLDDVINAL